MKIPYARIMILMAVAYFAWVLWEPLLLEATKWVIEAGRWLECAWYSLQS